ncbi:MAG: methylmalonyl-CoA mutase family protein [Actinomycetota bacterium]
MADPLPLASEFPPVSHEDWLEAVDKVLKGKSFDAVLRTPTRDGFVTEPLYTVRDERPVDAVPGPGAGRRASAVVGSTGGWDIRQRHALTTLAETNEAILTDLARGVTSIELDLDRIESDEAMDSVLADVYLDLAPVSLVAVGDGVDEARRFLALTAARGVASSELVADLGCDPIARLMRHGRSGRPIGVSLAAVTELAAEVARSHPGVRTVRADAGPAAAGGATPATEVAVAVASALEYARAMVTDGLPVADAFGQILLSVDVGTDQFGEIAKLRALRVLWRRVCEASGVADPTAAIQASTSTAVMSTRDPWVNMLRGTLGCFAAAVGGADIVQVQPFDALVGVPDDLGRRIARNTQLALAEETNLHRVIDPGGGSWYIESATDELAAAAWARFQEIEREGGVVASLRTGALQDRIARDAASLRESVATRSRPITGVSEFPHVDEAPLTRRAQPEPSAPGGDLEVEAIPMVRLAEPFEALRDRADATDPSPAVFLANLGPVSAHTARATWAKNFFEAGGIRAVDNDGFTSADAAAAAFSASGARIAVICSSDAVYADDAVPTASALVAAGADRVYLAGRPADLRADLERAGVGDFIHVGCAALDILVRTHDLLGTEVPS